VNNIRLKETGCISRSLLSEISISKKDAKIVTEKVIRLLIIGGFKIITTSFIREVVDAYLFKMGWKKFKVEL